MQKLCQVLGIALALAIIMPLAIYTMPHIRIGSHALSVAAPTPLPDSGYLGSKYNREIREKESMNKEDMVEEIIKPTLDYLEDHTNEYFPTLNDSSAVRLLLYTALYESNLRALEQEGGPALGYFQMEPATHHDIWSRYLRWRPELKEAVKGLLAPGLTRREQLKGNLYYATAMARIKYLRVEEKLPDAGDLWGLARYYKQYYNTEAGKGSVQDFVDRNKRLEHLFEDK